jgi:hypothetical protein
VAVGSLPSLRMPRWGTWLSSPFRVKFVNFYFYLWITLSFSFFFSIVTNSALCCGSGGRLLNPLALRFGRELAGHTRWLLPVA